MWFPFHRSRGLNDRPSRRPNLVYPLGVDPDTLRVVGVGQTLDERVKAGTVTGDLDAWLPIGDETVDGYPVVWPFLDDGRLTVWQANPEGLRELVDDGLFRVRTPSSPGPRTFTLAYVKSGNRQKTVSGEFTTVGYEPCGARIIEATPQKKIVKTVWKVPEHDARQYGTTMLRSLVGDTAFTYPKSPYAVVDCLKTVVADNPEAVILDFFGGSGTTLQAVVMLNSEDNGRRRTVLITNNEVGDDANRGQRAVGRRPGDPEYDAHGIFHAVTVPRVKAAIIGANAQGEIDGSYLNGRPVADSFEENAEFFTLTYEAA